MRVKMITMAAGPAGNLYPGQVYELDDARARDLVAGRYAVALDAPRAAPAVQAPPAGQSETAPPVETAGKPVAPEAATAPRQRGRRGG